MIVVRIGFDVPDWAMTYARAALQVGQKAAEIESALVDKGLSENEASAAVEHVLETRCAAAWPSMRYRWLNRGLSLAVVGGYAAVLVWAVGVRGLIAFCGFAWVVLPLACIWFAEAMGRYVGPTRKGWITSPTPPIFVMIGGWVLLLAPVIIVILCVLVR